MMSYGAIVWIMIAAVMGMTILLAVKFKGRLSMLGVIISFLIFAAAGFALMLLTDLAYKFCFASTFCTKITGDDEYSVLVPFLFFPTYWAAFMMVNYLKMKSSE